MRHRVKGRTFGRKSGHRQALFRNLAIALLNEERIRTTTIKAKELRGVVDRLITLGKRGDLHAKRLAFQQLNSHDIVKRLFDDIAPRFVNRNGGYTRVFKLAAPRHGDSAQMSVIELVERKEKAPTAAKKKPEKKRVEKKAETAVKVAAPEVKKETWREKIKRTFGGKASKEETKTMTEQKEAKEKSAETKSQKIHRKTGRNT